MTGEVTSTNNGIQYVFTTVAGGPASGFGSLNWVQFNLCRHRSR
ncbi:MULTISPECIES: hypothetical protein [Micromonospora]|nr:hypothetical protein [Verrucosispora sp. ts21]